MTTPAGRVQRVYKDDERHCIDPYKTEYLNATTPTARKLIVQAKILPDLFEHWARIGQEVPNDKMAKRRDVTQVNFRVLLYLI
jgi:hypothetical protein